MIRIFLSSLLTAILFICSCADDTRSYFDNPSGEILENIDSTTPWGIAVIGTDYLSTSVSIVDFENEKLFREGIITSGSSDSGLSIALSGDVVLSGIPNYKNVLVLIDRYPNSVLTFINPSDFSVMGQLSVATGFASNPQDFLWLTDHKAYVTRYETNPAPGKKDFDKGGDILVIDPTNREILSRIDIAEKETDIYPRPTHMVFANNLVWVAIDQLNRDFSKAGNGRVIAVDTLTDMVKYDIEIESFKNCTGITHAEKHNKLIVSCSGLFHNDLNNKLGESGIVSIDLSSDNFEIETIAEASGRPFGFEIEIFKDDLILCTHFGDLENNINDTLCAINLNTKAETEIHQVSTPYGMGGTLADSKNSVIYVGEADAVNPAIYLYTFLDGEFEFKKTINPCPKSGLPPRHIRFY